MKAFLDQQRYPKAGDRLEESLSHSRSDDRCGIRSERSGSGHCRVTDPAGQLSEHTTGGRPRCKGARRVPRHGSDGVDVFGGRVVLGPQTPCLGSLSIAGRLLGSRFLEDRHVVSDPHRTLARHQHVWRLDHHPASERYRVPHADAHHSAVTSTRTVGDSRVEFYLPVPVERASVACVQKWVLFEREDGRLDGVERGGLPDSPQGTSGYVRHLLGDARHASVYVDLIHARHGTRLEGRRTHGGAYDAGMSIYVVSDLHGAPDDLTKAVPEGSKLLLLGDLINFIDYLTMTGILTEVFSVEAVERVVELRTAGRVEEAREVMRKRSEGREEEIRSEIGRRVKDEYDRVFAALPNPTYLILGNVDQPPLIEALAGENPGVVLADGSVFEIEGERFGFVGGALPTPLGVAGEITHEAMRDKVEALGECDVLCSHIPPAIPELCYETVSGKNEQGSRDLLQYIEDVQPRCAYFGHVHQPLVSQMRVGRTLCMNVGYFRATKRAWLHQREVRDGG